MARRVPGARGLMEQAAVELYSQRGLSGPTAAEIAARAGVSERTFFRHFPDKLDVFFGDETRLREELTSALAATSSGPSALRIVLSGLRVLAAGFTTHRVAIVRRAEIIAAHPQLRERELERTFEWSEIITEALVARDVQRVTARRAALVALAVFRASYEEWIAGNGEGSLEDVLDATVERVIAELRWS